MRLTPRKQETRRVVDILTSDEFEDADSMAKEILKVTGKEILGHRDTWIVFNKPALLGPYGSEGEATKAAEKMPALSSDGIKVLRVFPTALQESYLEPDSWLNCMNCGHHKLDHLVNGNSRSKCGWENCSCSTWKEPK